MSVPPTPPVPRAPLRHRPPGHASRSRAVRRALGAALPFALAGAAGACVEIQSGPDGISSIGLDPVPPSIIAGDTLRDTLGEVVRLRARAYDGDGEPVEGTEFRYLELPAPGREDSASRRFPLVVDSVTGLVRAIAPRVATTGRLGARLGERLQILDTIAVVLPPTRLRRVARTDTVTLRYACTDTGRAVVPGDTTSLGNATPALAVRLTADSAGTAVGVPSAYVRYRILTPASIPRGTSPYGDERPAFYIAPGNGDRPVQYDTTGSTGQTTTRLRVLPRLLTRAAAPEADTALQVGIQVTALSGRTPIADTVNFVVRLVRRLPGGGPITDCP